MIRIAIAEDNKNDLTSLVDSIKYVERKLGFNAIIDHYDTGIKLLAQFDANYDIIFLDIEMPLLNGMELAKKIRKIDKNVMIIFVTNLAQMAVNGYEVEAFDFIVKPVNKDFFLLKIERALARLKLTSGENIIIKCKGELSSLRVDSIKYIESSGHYAIYHTVDGLYREYSSLKDVEKRLDNKSFAKCNQCFLVNFKYVTKFIQNEVYVDNTPLNMSRPQKKAFIEKYTKYVSGDFND